MPDENPTGEYRRDFDLPDWGVARILLRFDGVESVYRVWLNGSEVGVGKGSRLVQEFDVTELLRPGRNVIMVRVHQWSSMSYLEDQDQWWLPGIFRDVTLLGRPAGARRRLAAHRVRPTDGTGRRSGARGGPGRVPDHHRHPRARGAARPSLEPDDVTAFDVGPVDPWSAEQPRLYDAEVARDRREYACGWASGRYGSTVTSLPVNGRQVIFRGMNRHETHPDRGRIFDEDHARADLIMMKQHNVNAIRISHYPPHPRVLDLADELGFWVIASATWRPTASSSAAGRTTRATTRGGSALPGPDRAHRGAGQEPPVRGDLVAGQRGRHRAATWPPWRSGCTRRDPERPVHYEGDHTGAYTDIYSRMYPNLVETAAIGGQTGPLYLTSPAEARRVRSKPFLMCEYAHAMGNGPGALAEYDALSTRYPRLHGGFIWEWRDHGLRTRTQQGTEYFGYGGDFGEVVHDGNFVMDGMVLPDDTPTPGLAEFAAVNAPIPPRPRRLDSARHQPLHTRPDRGPELRRRARGRRRRADVALALPVPVPIDPGGGRSRPELTTSDRPGARPGSPCGQSWPRTQPWAPAGHVVARAQFPLRSPDPAQPRRVRRPAAPTGSPSGRRDHPGPGHVRRRHRSSPSLYELDVTGPGSSCGAAPTDNDRSDSRGSFELAGPEDTGGEGAPRPELGRARGGSAAWTGWYTGYASRRSPRTRLVAGRACSRGQQRLFVDVRYRWWLADDLALRVEVTPSSGWDCTWPRVGVRLDLPVDARSRRAGSALAAGVLSRHGRAARVGRFAAAIDDLASATRGRRRPATGRSCAGWSSPTPTVLRLRLRTAANPAGTGPASP